MSQPDANSPQTPPDSESSVPQSQATAEKFLLTLKTGTIRTLRSTSRLLDRTANRLESSEQLNPTVAKVANGVAIAIAKVLPLWNKLLTLIRDRLPADLNGKLGDRTLSGIVAGAIVVLFWFTSSLFSSKPPQPAQIATRPPVTIPAQPTQFPTDLSAPEAAPEIVSAPVEVVEEPIAEIPIDQPIAQVTEPAPIVEPAPEPTIEPTIEPSPEPIVESTPEPIVEVPPEPELTPEQKQLAAIQSQVTEISDRFIKGLVVAVEPNLSRARIKVRVSEDWYRFSSDQQDRFANELWERSQSLALTKLEITDAQGALLARNPIVGESMVILKRIAIA